MNVSDCEAETSHFRAAGAKFLKLSIRDSSGMDKKQQPDRTEIA